MPDANQRNKFIHKINFTCNLQTFSMHGSTTIAFQLLLFHFGIIQTLIQGTLDQDPSTFIHSCPTRNTSQLLTLFAFCIVRFLLLYMLDCWSQILKGMLSRIWLILLIPSCQLQCYSLSKGTLLHCRIQCR